MYDTHHKGSVQERPVLVVRHIMVFCSFCGESHRRDDKATCEKIQRENGSIMATRGTAKASKTAEEISEVFEAMNELKSDVREQKAQKEIQNIEAEIRLAALRAKVAELRRVKDRTTMKETTREWSSEEPAGRSIVGRLPAVCAWERRLPSCVV